VRRVPELEKGGKGALRWQRTSTGWPTPAGPVPLFRTPVETAAQESNARPPAAANTSSAGAAPAPHVWAHMLPLYQLLVVVAVRGRQPKPERTGAVNGVLPSGASGEVAFRIAASSVNTIYCRDSPIIQTLITVATITRATRIPAEHLGPDDSHHNNSRHNQFQSARCLTTPRQTAQNLASN